MGPGGEGPSRPAPPPGFSGHAAGLPMPPRGDCISVRGTTAYLTRPLLPSVGSDTYYYLSGEKQVRCNEP